MEFTFVPNFPFIPTPPAEAKGNSRCTIFEVLRYLPTLSIGKKRARTDDQNSVSSPSKKAKGDTPKKPGRVVRAKVPRPPKVNAATKAALKEKEKEGAFFT